MICSLFLFVVPISNEIEFQQMKRDEKRYIESCIADHFDLHFAQVCQDRYIRVKEQ